MNNRSGSALPCLHQSQLHWVTAPGLAKPNVIFIRNFLAVAILLSEPLLRGWVHGSLQLMLADAKEGLGNLVWHP